MTIEGAIAELQNLIKDDDVPFYYNGAIQKVIETIIDEYKPKVGKWKVKSFHECFCDNCGFSFDIMKCDFLENMKHCPNCGAKMERSK